MSKKSTKALASATIMSLVMTTSLAVPASAAVNQNLAGVGRYETAAKIVDAGWTTATTAIIASGEDANRVDALTVAPLAKKLDAPVVLAKPGKAIDADTLAKLTKLGVKTVYIANGTGVFTADVDAQLAKAGMTVKRLGGNSRFQTALNIAKEFGPAKSIVVASANDANLVDSLSIASIAAIKGMPIFISENDTLNADEAAYIKTLGVEKSYVVGGLVKDATLTAAGINGATRLAGAGRYESNYAVLNAFKDDADIKTATNVYVASGENANLIDALAGAPLAAKKGAPIVLAHDSILADTQTLLKGKVNKDTDVEIFGGTGAVTTNVATAFTSLLNGDTTTTDLKAGDITAVKAISNTKVAITFKDGVTPTTDAAAYKIVAKGTTTALAVSSAAVEDTKVVLTTAAQTAGTAYTLTAGTATMNFTGLAADKTAPSISKVACDDTNTVEVTFDRLMDKATAETVANYTLNNNATVKAASLDSTRKVVTLTTDGVSNSKLYTLTVQNVNNSDGVAIKKVSKNFIGLTDTTAPVLSSVVDRLTNNRLRLTFTGTHGIDKTAAETLANYSIKAGDTALAIKSITALDSDDDGNYDQVEICTDTQDANKLYTITISNLTDGSVSKNKPSKDLTASFRGLTADTSAPTVPNAVTTISNNKVEVVFNDTSALDPASATNPDNYVLDNDLKVEKVEILDTTADAYKDADAKTVVLTTSDQTAGKNYSLTIKGVADEFGNAIKPVSGTTYRKYYFAGGTLDVIPPYVNSVSSVDSNTVKVTFNEPLTKAVANDPTNYNFGTDLGSAITATLQSDKKTVKLTTPTQTANKSYKITINNLTDLCGNALSNVTASFVSTATSNDTTRPTVLYADGLYTDEVRVYFDEPITNTTTGTILTATASGTTVSWDFAGLMDDDTTLVLKPHTAVTDHLVNGKTYTIASVTGIQDVSGNKYQLPLATDATVQFTGTSAANIGPSVTTWEETDAKTMSVYFNENIALKNTTDGIYTLANDTDDPTLVYITKTSGAPFKAGDTDKVVLDLTQDVTDLVGTPAVDATDTTTAPTNKTTFTPYLDDTTKPEIASAEAISNNKVKITYTKDVDAGHLGTYNLTYKDSSNNIKYLVNSASSDGVNLNVVYLNVTGTLSSDTVYTVTPVIGAWDPSNNIADVKGVSFDFVGSDVVVNNYIKGVAINDATDITVSATYGLSTTASDITITEYDGVTPVTTFAAIGASSVTTGNKSVKYTLPQPLLDSKTYTLSDGINTYSFAGTVADGGINVGIANENATSASIVFSGMDSATQNVTVNSTGAGITFDASGCTLTGGTYTTTSSMLIVVTTKDGSVIYAAKVNPIVK